MTRVEDFPIPVFRTVASFREWRRKAYEERKSVGFVPTMGAMHAGHISLVTNSLAANDLTVVSIFVNPAQFAPHEDLDKYPRTFESDMQILSQVEGTAAGGSARVNAVFAPTASEMYPSGISQVRDQQRGTFVEVLGYMHQMEGKSRPGFFRGVASVVLRLFNAVEPTNAYLGQKDIQQGLLLRRMVRDVLLSHPSPENLHLVATSRDHDGLALSSRNIYLSAAERKHAPGLYASLSCGRDLWNHSSSASIQTVVDGAKEVIEQKRIEALKDGVEIALEYMDLTDSETFETPRSRVVGDSKKAYILSAAMKIGKTRILDNVILGKVEAIIC